MTRYLKTLVVALVAALMMTVGNSHDANARHDTAPEARAESVESLFQTGDAIEAMNCVTGCWKRYNRAVERCGRRHGTGSEEWSICMDESSDEVDECRDRCEALR